MSRVTRCLAGLVCLVLVGGGIIGTPAPVSGSTQFLPPDRPLSWLSLGDSMGSGEGASRASGKCQRSPNASGPKAASILRKQRGWNIQTEVFSACTGYLAADVFSSRSQLVAGSHSVFGERIEFNPLKTEVPEDESLADWVRTQHGGDDPKFDVISVSAGGNDVGFADILKDCLWPLDAAKEAWQSFASSYTYDAGCDDDLVSGGLTDRVDALFNEQTDDGFAGPAATVGSGGAVLGALVQVYRAIADQFLAPGGVVVVMGYPRLMTPSSDWQPWRGNQCNMIRRGDADALDVAAVRFDEQMRKAVQSLGDRFVYLSRLDVFDDGSNYHSLCARGVEWINTPLLFLRDGSRRYERGFHPNDLGYLAVAETLAAIVEQRLGQPVEPAPVPTSGSFPPPTTQLVAPPTIDSGEKRFDIGEEFEARCTLQWPASYGQTDVLMTMWCQGVPDQFLFVVVTYDDPNIQVGPPHKMIVRGVIFDIVRNGLGFTNLYVAAESLEFIS